MQDTKWQSSLITMLIVCVIFVALLSFLLPLFSVNFFGTHSQSGLDIVIEAIEDQEYPEVAVALCFVFSIIGLIFALLMLKSRDAAIGTIITSAISMLLMIIAMCDDSDYLKPIDYAAVGFYLYEIMNFAAIILSAASMYMSKSDVQGTDNPIPTPKPEPKPAPTPNPIPPTKNVCLNPKCKKENEKGAAFCRFCGTPLGKYKPTPPRPKPTPEPDPKPVPNPGPIIKNGKVICPHCGARHVEGTAKCKYCGTSFDGSKSVSTKPEPAPNPNPMPTSSPNPTPLKKDGKVICPHCGARQKEDAIKCKYCGTPIR